MNEQWKPRTDRTAKEIFPNGFDNTEGWPEGVITQPWVGKKYLEGIAGLRVLIAGESHFFPASEKVKTWIQDNVLKMGPRWREFFTRYECDRMDNPKSRNPKAPFDTYIDNLLRDAVERSVSEYADSASEGWSRIAFSNYVQEFAPPDNNRRPTRAQFKSAAISFRNLVHALKPDVILMIGKTSWDSLPDDGPILATVCQKFPNREIRKLDISEAFPTLLTWVYHPSSRSPYKDTVESANETFQALIDAAVRIRASAD